ncbi:MAG: HEAT repeat domain-containing protein [Methanothrix sp.]|nr:HEAT repeat domain-containing protein [Methanothrix sp.]
MRLVAANVLGSIFPLLLDKDLGWQDLDRLVHDDYSDVRRGAAGALGLSFAHLPDREQGWKVLIRLARDKDSEVRGSAAGALGLSFAHLPDREQGWKVLIRLARDKDSEVRGSAAGALGLSFAHLPDREQGWKVLIRLARDKDSEVRGSAAGAFGSSFALLPDKEAGWKVLIGLAQDQVSGVRMNAYHSLGRASIYRASEASEKNVIRAELEAAVEYFERSSKEKSYFNPARFCLPFYRSYLALTFQGASESEVQRYLAEAKEAVGSSENRRELFGAVENLAKALEETQDLKKKSKEQIQGDLKAYRWYCDRAAEHMAAAEEKTPGAVRLLRKCNPIIEERIETIIAGIQKTAREICQVTRDSGTKYEAPGARINQEAKSLSSEDPIKAFKGSTRIASILREFCSLLPKGKRGHACEIVDEIESEQDLPSRLSKIELALTYLQPNISLEAYELATAQKLDLIDKKLDTVIHDLAKIKIGTGNIFANLCAVRSGLAAIAESGKKAENPENASGHQYTPDANQIKMGDLIDAKVLELEEILKTKATKEDNQAILNKLESLKPSVGWEWLGRLADLIAVFDASIKVLQFLA